MERIRTVFSDIGGVILTNGWDRGSRREAVNRFHLDGEEYEERHDLTFAAFDAGLITLNEYLDRTIFYRQRPFTREEFTAFLFAQSKEYPQARAILNGIADSGKYFVAAINNEPLELNKYRIETFDLRRDFQVFFSSCYLKTRKPDETIFRMALEVTQRPAEECVFIDDRPVNLESPQRLGMHVIHYRDPEQLKTELSKMGVSAERR